MRCKSILAGAAIASALAASAPAHATTYEYVGSWEVDSGPRWNATPTPAALSGQEVAALLFGGLASNYVISTVDSSVADINFDSWVSVYGGTSTCSGLQCGEIVGDSSVISNAGLYDAIGDTSAYVSDRAIGSQYINYAFVEIDTTPLPAALPLFAAGLGVMGLISQRRKRKASTIAA